MTSTSPSQVCQNYHQDSEAAINRQINLELAYLLRPSNLECSKTWKGPHEEIHSEPSRIASSRPVAGSGGQLGSAEHRVQGNLPRAGPVLHKFATDSIAQGRVSGGTPFQCDHLPLLWSPLVLVFHSALAATAGHTGLLN
uniref:Uncharacterized protein n=1 Tax=Peromyscus maniculatus bairdii TaxID=230844 RepID=A0A8C8UQM1_PERMB